MLFNLKHHCTKRLCHVVNNQKVRTGILNMLELQATFKKACTLNFLPLCDTADLVSTNSCVCLNSFTIGISFIRFFPPLPPPPEALSPLVSLHTSVLTVLVYTSITLLVRLWKKSVTRIFLGWLSGRPRVRNNILKG